MRDARAAACVADGARCGYAAHLAASRQHGAGKESAAQGRAGGHAYFARARIREARSPLMPKIMFTESAVRGNDPVFVFGTQAAAAEFHRCGLRAQQAEYAHADRQFLQPLLRTVEPVRRPAKLVWRDSRQVHAAGIAAATRSYRPGTGLRGGAGLRRRVAGAEASRWYRKRRLKTARGDRGAKPGARRERHGGGLRFAQRAGSHGVAASRN